MGKTVSPGKVELPHGSFEANAVPDVFDARDLDYRPRLQVLPNELECRPQDRHVTSQLGNSCTGHAVAAMANAVFAAQGERTPVSPYMIYSLARRYDDFQGDADVGSSLRGALKGWYYHGLLPQSAWPDLAPDTEPDIDHDAEVAALARQRPLGAFYRVNATRLDDLQSAINELSAIVVAASIHDGWREPVVVKRKRRQLHVISKTSSSQALGGHAFCLVGYNEVGFLVQNSWGVEWGHRGFATLPYDDWLESGYDAWVARPGVPSVVSERTRRKVFSLAGGGLVDAPGPDLVKLARHVVNLGNNGRLSTSGRFTSSAVQVDKVFDGMAKWHKRWQDSPRRVVLYAHGGLNSEQTGLDIAQRQVNWWLTNEVYPITFAWQTGLAETLGDQLGDMFGVQMPAGGWPFNLYEQVDRMVEKTAKSRLRWVWQEMKENAARASDPLPRTYRKLPSEQLPGASLVVARLKAYLASKGNRNTEVHLVGHSAGSIFLTFLLERLVEQGVPVTSLTYLAPAERTDVWLERVLPHLESHSVGKFASFGMDPIRELDDVVAGAGVAVYHKSLLYLVSKALERSDPQHDGEVPLVGMAHFAETEVAGTSLVQAVDKVGGSLVWSPEATSPQSRSDSATHGGFDDDSATMTSVLLRILEQDTVRPGNEYVPNLPAPAAGGLIDARPTALEDQPPEIVMSEVQGQAASARKGHAQTPSTPARTSSAARRGTAKPRGRGSSRVIDALKRDGWTEG
jgi:hypothetical protein